MFTSLAEFFTRYIVGLAPLAKYVPKHILHEYSREMSQKSEVYILDVLMKNDADVDIAELPWQPL